MSNRTTRMWALALTLSLIGCSATSSRGGGVSPSGASGADGHSIAASSSPKQTGIPSDQGPFAGLHWNPLSLRPGSLLHDDGRRLWTFSPGGARSLVWSHPRAAVYELAADVDARTIAMVVGSGRIQGAYLYLLQRDGSVKAIRRVSGGWDIWVPIFAKSPTDPHGPTRVYWTEHSPGLFDRGTDTPVMRTMTYDGSGVSPVRIPLLWGEAPWRLDSYPGNTTMSLTLFRRSNIPTFHQVLRNEDLISGGASSSDLQLGYWQQIADTDSEAGVAWLSPNRYVIQVGKSPRGDGAVPWSSLVAFEVGCEFAGGKTIWSGSMLDPGTFNAYSLLAPDPSHILALEQASGSGSTRVSHGWVSIDTRTGDLSRSHIRWSTGPWAAVRPAAPPTAEGPHCA
jgi:hypothetical protein